MTPQLLTASDFTLHPLAKKIAAQHGLTFVEHITQPFVYLCLKQDGLYLQKEHLKFKIDFLTYFQKKSDFLKQQVLFQAIGKVDPNIPIWDGTLGTGKDSFALLLRGHRVHAFEKNKMLGALLEDAIKRAEAHPALRTLLQTNFKFNCQNTLDALSKKQPPLPEVLYLDPMFEKLTKGAPNLGMQLLRELDDRGDNQQLLLKALELKIPKIVVKRNSDAPFLEGQPPSQQVLGTKVRFDVYLP